MMNNDYSDWKRRVQEYGCIACRIDHGQVGREHDYMGAELHHINEGGMTRLEWAIIPLCCGHHSRSDGKDDAIHRSKTKFRERYGHEWCLFFKTYKYVSAHCPEVVDEILTYGGSEAFHAALAAECSRKTLTKDSTLYMELTSRIYSFADATRLLEDIVAHGDKELIDSYVGIVDGVCDSLERKGLKDENN